MWTPETQPLWDEIVSLKAQKTAYYREVTDSLRGITETLDSLRLGRSVSIPCEVMDPESEDVLSEAFGWVLLPGRGRKGWGLGYRTRGSTGVKWSPLLEGPFVVRRAFLDHLGELLQAVRGSLEKDLQEQEVLPHPEGLLVCGHRNVEVRYPLGTTCPLCSSYRLLGVVEKFLPYAELVSTESGVYEHHVAQLRACLGESLL